MIDLNSIPFVGPLVAKISDKTIEALFRHVEYMFRYKGLVKDLKSENDKLLAEETKMSRKAEQERNNGRILEKYVVAWQKEVQEEQEKVTRCLQENEKLKSQQQNCPRYIRYIPLPHPISRYRLGKEAAKVAKSTTELTATGSHHLESQIQIAYLPLDMNVPVTAFHKFESREKAYEKLEGLVNAGSFSILGIYGIGGAGKTRLMERITTEAVKQGTFHKVVRANVGNEKLENKTIISIQNQIAGNLGCVFERQDDVGHRAGQLRSSLKQGGKILIILDDVWSRIPLGTIGIMSADGMSSKGGKILLTTRDHEVCQHNDCGDLVKVEPLTPAEAWDMFSETVGAKKIVSLQNISVAEDICKRCGGLPLVILAVGNALKFKPFDSWKDARNQLKNSKIERVSGISKDVYACLKLSFDHLEDDDAKACLLLSSMWPEDADIPIRELVLFARGSEQLVDSQLMKGDEIRTRVQSMIYILKSASLLLPGKDSEHIKLHDIIRDMARSIATKDYAFLFARSGSLSNNPAEYSARKFLHIDVEKETSLHFPINVECPELRTLSLYSSSWPKRPLIQMSYDRSWITRRIIPGGYGFTDEYNEGVKYFLAFARSNSKESDDPNLLIRCPCNTCRNLLHQLIPDVEFHLFATGFLESYTIWHYHGESRGSRNEQMNDHEDVYDEYEMLRDAFGPDAFEEENNIPEDPNEQATKFLDNVNNVGEPIYPGNIKYTQLKFVSR